MANDYVFNDTLPVAPLKIAALESCKELAQKDVYKRQHGGGTGHPVYFLYASHGSSLFSMRGSRSIKSPTASEAGLLSNRTSLTCSTIGSSR